MELDKGVLEKELKDVSPKVCAVFAYRCALRVFPLLAEDGNFSYWKEKRKTHLYSLFRALDTATADAYAYADAAADADVAAAAAADDAAVAYAAAAAAYAADAAAYAAVNAQRAASRFSDSYKQEVIKSILSDLALIKNSETEDAFLKAPLWSKKSDDICRAEEIFKDALESPDINFAYWRDIYQQHVDGNIDLKALKQRLTIPEEVTVQGGEFVAEYLIGLSGKTLRLNEVRIIFMGDGGSGKTSLIRRLFGEDMCEKEESTTEIIVRKKRFTESQITGHFWDFGGQVMLHATHQLFLRERCIYVVVLDGRKEEDPEYWLDHVKVYGGSSPVFIVKNKCDLGGSKDIPFNTLKEKYGNIVENYNISCIGEEEWTSTTDSFSKALENYVSQRKEDPAFNPEMPESFFDIMKKLETLKNEKENKEVKSTVSYDTFSAVCREFGIKEEEKLKHLMSFYDSLGVLLKFSNHSDYVLNPDWLSVGAYRIIRSDKVQSNRGILHFNELSDILKSKEGDLFEYHYTKYRFLLEVLNSFELLYFLDVNAKEEEKEVLIPSLLPNDQIKDLDTHFDRKRSDLLYFIYDFTFLPSSVMTRFIVKMHDDINPQYLWRHGVILTDKSNRENSALVIENEKAKRITVSVHGSDARGYFSTIRKILREILESSFTTTYHKETLYTEHVPLGRDKNGTEVSIEYDVLLAMEGEKESSFKEYRLMFPDESGRLKPAVIDVQMKLNGYSSPEQRQEGAGHTTVYNNCFNSTDHTEYNANDAGVVNQGDYHRNIMKDMRVTVGVTEPEKKKLTESADELIDLLRQSLLPEKDKAIRFLENVKDEIADYDGSDSSAVKKQLIKIEEALEPAGNEKWLMNRVNSFFKLFSV